MCHSLHVAVNKCINWCFVHLFHFVSATLCTHLVVFSKCYSELLCTISIHLSMLSCCFWYNVPIILYCHGLDSQQMHRVHECHSWFYSLYRSSLCRWWCFVHWLPVKMARDTDRLWCCCWDHETTHIMAENEGSEYWPRYTAILSLPTGQWTDSRSRRSVSISWQCY